MSNSDPFQANAAHVIFPSFQWYLSPRQQCTAERAYKGLLKARLVLTFCITEFLRSSKSIFCVFISSCKLALQKQKYKNEINTDMTKKYPPHPAAKMKQRTLLTLKYTN